MTERKEIFEDIDGRAAAILCADQYENVALGENGHTVMVEMSDIFLPDALKGFAVSHVQLVPMGPPNNRRLEFVFTREAVNG